MEESENIERKVKIVRNVLNNVCEILTLFKPLLNRMMEMEDAEKFKKNGTFGKAAHLFGEISEQCKELEGTPFLSDEFYEDLAN